MKDTRKYGPLMMLLNDYDLARERYIETLEAELNEYRRRNVEAVHAAAAAVGAKDMMMLELIMSGRLK